MATDLRIVLRRLATNPGSALVSAATLALAIATAAGIYSVVDATLFKPLPYRNGSSLQRIELIDKRADRSFYIDKDILFAWQDHAKTLASLAPYGVRGAAVRGASGAEMTAVSVVDGGLFELLGAVPVLGRNLEPADAAASAIRVAVIGESFWKSRFGSDPKIIGQQLFIDGVPHDIVGVIRSDFRFPVARDQIWLPLRLHDLDETRYRGVQVIAQLVEGVSAQEAERELTSLVDSSGRRAAVAVRIVPFRQLRNDQTVGRTLSLVLGAVLVILLMSLLHVGQLLMVRNASRKRDRAIRAALGASAWNVVRHDTLEFVVIVLLGGVLGAVGTVWVVRALAVLCPPEIRSISANPIAVDGRVLLFIAAISTTSALFIGLLPALSAWMSESRGAFGLRTRASYWWRASVGVMELSVSVVLLSAAGFIAVTFHGLATLDPGFDTHNLAVVDLLTPRWKPANDNFQNLQFETVLNRVRRIPGVRGAEFSTGLPPGTAFIVSPQLRDSGSDHSDGTLAMLEVGPRFFAVTGLRILEGRVFSPEDMRTGNVVVVSRSLARALWSERSAAREWLQLGEIRYRVLGIVGDVPQLESGGASRVHSVYLPLRQRRAVARTLLVRTDRDPLALMGTLKAAIWSVDKDLSMFDAVSVDALQSSFLAAPRFYAHLMVTFAALATAISILGLYGVVGSLTAGRRKEFAIRCALGADRRSLVRTAMAHGVLVALGGTAIGFAMSVVASRIIGAYVSWIQANDPSILLGAGLLLLMVAAIAVWLPASRAGAINPSETLRQE